jgi:putative ABC transport system permease protein
MSIVRQPVRGFRNLIRRKRADGDIADEVDSFITEAKADFEARGLTAQDAARATRMALGSSMTLREEARLYGWENMIDGIFQDLRYTLRRLRATPGFTLVSIGTLLRMHFAAEADR